MTRIRFALTLYFFVLPTKLNAKPCRRPSWSLWRHAKGLAGAGDLSHKGFLGWRSALWCSSLLWRLPVLQRWTEKTTLMTNNTSDIIKEIKVNVEEWDSHNLQVPRFSYNWQGFQSWDIVQDSKDEIGIDKVSWDQCGTIESFHSVSRYDWCDPSSHSSSWMLVSHGLSQQSCKG